MSIAAPMPWITLKATSDSTDQAAPQAPEAIQKMRMPVRKTFLRPIRSASRPNGIRSAAKTIT